MAMRIWCPTVPLLIDVGNLFGLRNIIPSLAKMPWLEDQIAVKASYFDYTRPREVRDAIRNDGHDVSLCSQNVAVVPLLQVEIIDRLNSESERSSQTLIDKIVDYFQEYMQYFRVPAIEVPLSELAQQYSGHEKRIGGERVTDERCLAYICKEWILYKAALKVKEDAHTPIRVLASNRSVDIRVGFWSSFSLLLLFPRQRKLGAKKQTRTCADV